MREVRKERTDWRDSNLDWVHEQYGYKCPADNTEFLMVEYDMGTPVALVDYRLKKRDNMPKSDAVSKLCNDMNAELPYVSCRYSISNGMLSDIDLIPFNHQAETIFGGLIGLSEKEYVRKLYQIREKIVPGRTQQGKQQAELLRPSISNNQEKWKGEILSHRHRDWGWDCPVVDVDFVVYKGDEIKALVEYKNSNSFATPKQFRYHPTGKTLSNLADNHIPRIPLLFVYYNDDFTILKVYPVTYGWSKYDDYFGVELSREEYFKFLDALSND